MSGETHKRNAKRYGLLILRKSWFEKSAHVKFTQYLPTKYRMRIWCERGSVLYQKRIDGRKTWRKSFTCVCSRERHPLPRNKFSVRNVICTRSGKLSTLQRKLSRATSRVVKSSAVACPSSAILRQISEIAPPTSSEKTCRETHLERVNLIESTKSVVSWPHCLNSPVIPMEYNKLLTWFSLSASQLWSRISYGYKIKYRRKLFCT